MTEGVRAGGFTAANNAEKQRATELNKKLSDDAVKARQHGETEWQQQIQTEKKALEDDQVVSSTAVRDLGKDAGWNENRMNDALSRHDVGRDGVYAEDEFDLLTAEMEPPKPKGYEVASGDSLSKMTQDSGRDASRWNELYEHNKDVVGSNPDLIHPGQTLEKPPGWVVEDAQIDPATPTHQVPDRQDEMRKAAQIADAETLGQAKQALDAVPEDSPKRAEYEQKIKDLEQAYETKWKPAEEPAGGSTPPTDDVPVTPPADDAPATPPADEQAKADHAAMLQDPAAARDWDASRKGKVQAYAEAQIDAKLAEAGDPQKSPGDRLKAAQEAEKIATDTMKAAEAAGHGDIARGLADNAANAQAAVQQQKLASGDRETVEKAIGEAGTDKAKLKAIADALPKDDPRAKALTAIADGKVKDDVAQKLLDALKDQSGTRGDFAEALQRSGGDKAAIEAAAAVADYKAQSQDDPDARAEMTALATSLHAMAKAGDQVRQELAKGFDDRGNLGDYERAVDAATSKEDLQALQAFVDHKKASEKGTGRDTFNGKDPSARLAAAIDHYDALKASPEAWKQVQNLLHDDRDNKDDLIRAGKATGDPAALRALAKLAEAVGEFDLAANFYDLTDPKYKDAAPETREAILKRD